MYVLCVCVCGCDVCVCVCVCVCMTYVCACDRGVCTLVIQNALCAVGSTLWNKHHLAMLVGQHHLRVEGRREGGGRKEKWEGQRGGGRIKYAAMIS